MTYEYITSDYFPGQTPNSRVAATFGYARPAQPTIDVVHWWNTPEQAGSFDTVRAFFRGNTASGTSAHYVVDAGRVAQGVDEANASHANGNAWANAVTVTWELNPNRAARAQVIETFCEAVADCWIGRRLSQPGKLTYHQMYTATACPGDFISLIPSMQAKANAYFWVKKNGTGNSAAAASVSIEKDEFDMANIEEVFTTKRREWGNRSLDEVIREIDRNTWSVSKQIKHLFNLYRLGIPSVISDGTFGARLRSIFGYDETKDGKARKAEYDQDSKNAFRW